jgi:hypothetical protein
MRTITNFILIILCVSALLACKKHSVFSGKVTNGADGLPIEGVEVSLRFNKGKKGGGSLLIDEDIQKTNINGDYIVEADASGAENGTLNVVKEGYAPRNGTFVEVEPGDNRKVDFNLYPFDSWLDITFTNASAKVKKLYYYYNGHFLGRENYHVGNGGPFYLQPGEYRTDIFVIPGEENILVYYDTTGTGLLPYSFVDSIFCNRNDTTKLTINLK